MQKKPVEKAVEVKEAVKATDVKAKVEDVKAVAKEKEAAAKESVAKTVETAAKKAEDTVKKAEDTVKKAARKTTAKKTATKKAAAKPEMVPEVFVQFNGNEDGVKDVIERAKAAFVADGHRPSSIKTLQVYLKPEEYAAYYVVNDKYAGRVNLF